MKLKFDSALSYQQEAIAAVCDVFKGQTAKESLFTVAPLTNEQISFNFGGGHGQTGQGIGNRLELDGEELLNNIRDVQLRNGLPQSKTLGGELNLDIEMETGTGKTYVYLRTLLELNKSYGFTKFIIVVPSIAIKEGVKKTIDITREHFRALYNNVNYDAFVYSGDHIEKIRDFATASDIQIMIINIDAFQKTTNLINRYNDKKFGEMLPIDLVKETNPIVIIDEPQSVISTDERITAVKSFNPLCTIRYSATPIKIENKLYRLNAVDSFEKKLVKGIEVESFSGKDNYNDAYLLLKSVNNKKSPITAKIEIDKQEKSGVKRKVITVKQGDDLFEKSGGRDVYEGYIVKDIYCAEGNEAVDFTSNSQILRIGKPVGGIADDEKKRQQIRATIEEHLNKEIELNPKGIKVLSLFFIDKVANYREYDAEGKPMKGKYARWFEEIYSDIISRPRYRDFFHSLLNEADEAERAHEGYFSQDKGKKNAPGKWKDTKGDTAADDSAYNLIMKDKERLLSFDSKVRFIFSHSALKEGWDNPNVFQICALNETKSSIKKRQEIGRGLRLCVNQKGERQYEPNLNILTVMANESYDEFASALQTEYEKDGVRFSKSTIKDHKDRKKAELNKEVFLSDDFKELWDKIKWKTTYRVNFDSEELIKKCRERMARDLIVNSGKIIQTRADLCVSAAGVGLSVKSNRKVKSYGHIGALPDIIAYLRNETNLTGRAIVEILTGTRKDKDGNWKKFDEYGDRLKDFRKNPQVFMEETAKILRSVMKSLIIDGIRYQKIGDGSYYSQELFESEELKGYLESNMMESKKGIYRYVVYDSENERKFAAAFEQNEDIVLYAKLPNWFKVPTPLGAYNPDWVVTVNQNGEKKLYFVLETKGNIDTDALRATEREKISCGKAHFEALKNDATFLPVDDFDEFMEGI